MKTCFDNEGFIKSYNLPEDVKLLRGAMKNEDRIFIVKVIKDLKHIFCTLFPVKRNRSFVKNNHFFYPFKLYFRNEVLFYN